jgi:hypothetical protein
VLLPAALAHIPDAAVTQAARALAVHALFVKEHVNFLRRALKAATLPKGDFAFAAAVAAFGQVLRGDEMMMGFGFAEIDRLAGEQNTAGQDNFWRQEFLRLNALAGSMKGG